MVLAAIGATLADGGTNPLTNEWVIDAEICHYTLAVMTTAGLYESSGFINREGGPDGPVMFFYEREL